MPQRKRFADDVVDAIDKSKILGIRAGTQPHRVIGIWVVVVQKRVFVRSWSIKPRSWYRTLLQEPRGIIQIGDREIPVRAVHTRSETLKDAVDVAYAKKYNTPGSIKYVKDLCGRKSKDTTTELVPLR